MRQPVITPHKCKDGRTVFRVYDNYNPHRRGRTYIGTAKSESEAAEMFAEHMRTGKIYPKARKGQSTERRCWIVPKVKARGEVFELYGHEENETKRGWLGSTRTREDAEAARSEYLATGTLPRRRVGEHTPRNGVRQTRQFVQTPISIPAQRKAALATVAPISQPLTDEQKAWMKQMLSRIG